MQKSTSFVRASIVLGVVLILISGQRLFGSGAGRTSDILMIALLFFAGIVLITTAALRHFSENLNKARKI